MTTWPDFSIASSLYYMGQVEMMRRHAGQRRVLNMLFVFRHRRDTRMCRRLLASPLGSYKTMTLCVAEVAS